jgi:hypothetical protein
MPTSAGPNSKGENSLVFAFDMADTRNSNLGEPTENLFLNPTFIGDDRTFTISQNWGWSGYSGQSGWRFYDKTNSPVPLKFPNEQAVITTGKNDDPEITTNRRFYCYVVLEPNTTYTVSVWMYYDGTGNMSNAIAHFEYDDSGNGLPLNSGYFKSFATFIQENNISRGEWFRFQDTYTTGVGHERGTIGPVISGTKSNLIAMQRFQIEKKSYATPFVNGERTSGGSNLINKTPLSLNVSYTSDKTFEFDGTDDLINTGITSENWAEETFTLEAVVKYDRVQNHSWFEMSRPDSSSSGFISVTRNNEFYFYWIGPYGGNGHAVNSPLIVPDQYIHMVITFNGVGGNDQQVLYNNTTVYLNGVNTPHDWLGSAAISYGGELYYGSNQYKMNGEVPLFKYYNRELLAEEVSANFEVIRKRFNI